MPACINQLSLDYSDERKSTKILVAYDKVDAFLTHGTCLSQSLSLSLSFYFLLCYSLVLYCRTQADRAASLLDLSISRQWGKSNCRPRNHTVCLIASSPHHFCSHPISQNKSYGQIWYPGRACRDGQLKWKANNIWKNVGDDETGNKISDWIKKGLK